MRPFGRPLSRPSSSRCDSDESPSVYQAIAWVGYAGESPAGVGEEQVLTVVPGWHNMMLAGENDGSRHVTGYVYVRQDGLLWQPQSGPFHGATDERLTYTREGIALHGTPRVQTGFELLP